MQLRLIIFAALAGLCLALQPVTALAAPGEPLSAEEAQSLVARFFPVGETKLLNSRLIEPVTPSENPNWTLIFEGGATALVDSVTGKVKQWASVPNAATAQGDMTVERAQQIALRLITAMYPDYASKVGPDPVRPAQSSSAGVQLLFTRMVNGALFPANGFQVNVNPDGSIAAFQTQWQESVAFPTAQKLIGEEAAIERTAALLTSSPRTYLFYQVVAQNQPPKLFYLVKTATAEMALDAQTGVPAGGIPPGFKPAPDRAPYLWGGAVILWILTVALAFWMGSRRQLRSAPVANAHPQSVCEGGDIAS